MREQEVSAVCAEMRRIMKEFRIAHMVVGQVATNCYLLYNNETRKTIMVDPPEQGARLYETLKQNQLELEAILLTHGHFDHIGGVNELRKLAEVPVYIYSGEADLAESASLNCSNAMSRSISVKADKTVEDGETLQFPDMPEIKVIHTPGHTAGSVCYYLESEGILICGDTLFQESVGRTDLPTGSQSALVKSVREKLFVLPDEVIVYPGHGDETTIGFEKMNNPYV